MLAVLSVTFLTHRIIAQEPGNRRMQEIACAICEGAMAFHKPQYRTLSILIFIIFTTLTFFLDIQMAICFLGGDLLEKGMKEAVKRAIGKREG